MIELNSSVNENNTSDLLIIPNPSDGIFMIEGFKKGSFDLSVYNILGKLLYYDIKSNNEVDLTFLPDGIYFLQLDFNNKIITEKIIIK